MSKPQPDWKANIVQRYQRKGNPWLGPLQVKVSLTFVQMMDRAAAARGMTRASFIRRSVAVQIAAALDMDVHRLLMECPSVKPHGIIGGHFNGDGFDTGEGIEEFYNL